MMTTSRRAAPLAALLLLAACAAPAGAPSASVTEPVGSRPPFETVNPSPSDDAAAQARRAEAVADARVDGGRLTISPDAWARQSSIQPSSASWG